MLQKALTPRQHLAAKYLVLTDLYLAMVRLNTRAFFPGTKMGEYCELLIIVKTILNRQVKHRRTSLGALAKAIEISRTTLYRRLVRLTEMGVVEHHGHEFVLAPGLICTPDAIRSVERIAAVVEDSTKKLSNLEH